MPTATSSRPAPRERLLTAAETLFYDEGIHIGVDRLCAVAEVSKRSMYQHFGSKDEVIVEMLRGRAHRLASAWSSTEGLGPRARILAVFESVRDLSALPDFHGCPFVNVATELKDREHPASVAALGYKLELNGFFEDQARSGGAADPQALGVQLTMIFDGACAYSVVRGGTTDAALTAAETHLDAQGVTD
jgi:AcrR family transcriptional regulator